MSADPSISLIIVNQDRRDDLARLLSSLRFQRLMPSEIIVVTNLPEGDRPETPLDILWLQCPERGISAARNTAIAAASGDIVAFCDDDAVPEFDWLRQLTDPLGLRGVASSGGYVRGRNGVSFQNQTTFFDRYGRDWQEKTENAQPRIFPPNKDTILKTLGTNCAFRREALVEIGGFDEDYQHFLSEADVNIRLSDVGMQTAIVPLAEVHHSLAGSRRRTSRRVPEHLFETGASKAHFCQKFSNLPSIDSLMPEFIQEHDAFLKRCFQYGLIEADRYHTLMAELHDGLKQGRTRGGKLLDWTDTDRPDLPHSAVTERPRHLITTNLRHRKQAFEKAREAADAGGEVTVMMIEYTIRPLKVWYDADGFWVHRIGLLGRDERHRKARPASAQARIDRELARIEPQRQLLADKTVSENFC